MSGSTPRSALQAAGLKATKPREVLLRILEASDQPLTVDQISERLDPPRPGRPTLYRNLERFIQEGWAESFVDEDHVQRFMYCRTPEHHHHIHCERCKRVAELDGCLLAEALERLQSRTGYLITEHRLQLYGLCPDCRQEGEPRRRAARVRKA